MISARYRLEHGVRQDHAAAVALGCPSPNGALVTPTIRASDARAGRRRLARVEACGWPARARTGAASGCRRPPCRTRPANCGLTVTSSARAGDGHPAREHHRPFHGLPQRPRSPAGRQVSAPSEPVHGDPVVDDEQPERGDLGQRRDLRPVEAGLVRQHGDGRGQRASPQPVESRVAAPGPGHRGEHRRRQTARRAARARPATASGAAGRAAARSAPCARRLTRSRASAPTARKDS